MRPRTVRHEALPVNVEERRRFDTLSKRRQPGRSHLWAHESGFGSWPIGTPAAVRGPTEVSNGKTRIGKSGPAGTLRYRAGCPRPADPETRQDELHDRRPDGVLRLDL